MRDIVRIGGSPVCGLRVLQDGFHGRRSGFRVELGCAAFLLPSVPFPLLHMCQAIHAQQRHGAVVFIAVVRKEVYPDVAVEVP